MKSITITLCLLALLVIGFTVSANDAAKSAAAQPTSVSTPGRISASPDMAIGADGSINLIWVDKGEAKPEDHSAHAAPAGRPPAGGPPTHTHKAYNDLYFARSTDGGVTFTKPLRINGRDGELWGFATSKPRIAVSKSGFIHIFYQGNRNDASATRQAVDTRYTRSTDGGKTFEPVRTLNTTGVKGLDDGELDEAHCFGTMGVAPNGDVHAYWIDTRLMKKKDDNGAVYGVVSRNEGKTFEEERLIFENEACPCCQLNVAFSADNKVYLSLRSVFADGSRDGAVARSDDGGKTFAPRVRVSDKSWKIQGCPLKPTMMAIGKSGRMYAAWFAGEMQPAGAFFAASEDGGKTFAKPVALHPEAKTSDHAQMTVAADGTVHVAWDARVGEVRRIYLRSSNDHGKTFGAVSELEAPAGAADYPVIGTNKQGKLIIAWQQSGQIMLRALPSLVAQK